MKIRSIPVNVNPTPRPSTSSSRTKEFDLNSSKKISFPNDLEITSDVVDEEYLKNALKVNVLTNLKDASLILNTSLQTVSHIGEIMPNLRRLCLNSSSITSIRDLGTSLRCITQISLNDCTLNELDGIAALASLKELSVRHNSIADVTPLAMLEYLERVDLHGNRIADLAFADALSSCPNLTNLCLTKNPIERAPMYRVVIISLIPALRVLDEAVVEERMRGKASHGMILEAAAAMSLAREEMDDELRLESDIVEGEKQYTESSNASAIPDTGSDLTHGVGAGVVLVGGMAAALRRRRTAGKDTEDESSALLTVLDSGLVTDLDGTSANGGQGSTFCEGDVTAQLSNIKDFLIPGHQAMLERVKTAQARVNTASGKPGTGPSSILARPMTSPFSPTPLNRRPNTSGSMLRQNGEFSQELCTPPRPMTAANGLAPSAPFKVTVDTTAAAARNTNSSIGKKSRAPIGVAVNIEVKSELSPVVRSGQSKSKPRRRSGSDNDSSDSESYAITHAERHRLMAVSSRVVESPEPEESTQAGLYRGLAAVSAVTRAIPQSQRQEIFPVKSQDEKDLDSPPKLGAALRATSTASLAGISLGFDLKGSLAAIEHWAGGDGDGADSQSGSEAEVKHVRPTKISAVIGPTATRGILSRDAIISMCVGEEEPPMYEYSESGKKTRRKKLSTQTQPDILVINHDDSCELGEEAVALSTKPKVKQPKGRKSKSRSTTTAPATKETITRPQQYVLPAKGGYESDGYGDLDDMLMTDFDLGGESHLYCGRSEVSGVHHMNGERDMDDRHSTSPNRIKGRSKKHQHQLQKKSSPTKLVAEAVEATRLSGHTAVSVPLSTRVSTNKLRNNNRRKHDAQLAAPVIQVQTSIDEDDGCDPKRTGKEDGIQSWRSSHTDKDFPQSGMTKAVAAGAGVAIPNDKLIYLLTRPPKDTPELKTRSSYQEFFRGMPRQRMVLLLEAAYGSNEDGQSRIAKRLQLLNDVLV